MKVDAYIIKASDGGFSCQIDKEGLGFVPVGYGDTAAEAKADMLVAIEEIGRELALQGKAVPGFEIIYHYDMKSFFDYFDFLNISKIGQRAGINPGLMRRYASGVANASEAQYAKLHRAVSSIAAEMSAATF